MSAQGIVDLSIPPQGKIYDTYLPNPYPYPAQPSGLAAVLAVNPNGDDAGNQNISNLLQLETTNVVQQDQIGGHLTIGGTPSNPGSGGDLRIQGATLKGSILAGDGTSTVGIPVGVDGLVLTTNSAQATGLEWAVGGGGGGVASVAAGLNIGITGTAANPIVGVLNPLTSVLNLAGQNITGTTSAIIQTDINVALSQSQLDAGGLDIFSTAAPGNTSQITFTGFTSSAAGSGDTMVLSPTSLTKSVGTTQMGITNAVAGQNIAIDTSTTGIITSNCAIKPAAIRDSASSDGTSGQVLTAGTGGQLLWGANGVSSVSAGTNISITGTASVPVVNIQNPLTATLNIGTQSITGSTSNITLSSGTNQANMNGNLGFTSAVQATPTTKATLFNTGISVETATNKVIIQPTQILKTIGSSTLTIGSAVAPLSLIGNGALADGIQIQQSVNYGTTLTTNLSNVKYYPDTYLTNNDSITQAVPLPQVIHQRLTLNNLGLTNTSIWNDYGGNAFAGYSAFFIDSNSNVWLAEAATGNIQVYDNPPNTLLHSIAMTGTLTGGPTAVNVFYEQGGYVFIGGNFSVINGNAQGQFGIARVALSSYTEDLMFDSLNSEAGVAGGEVFDITDVAGELDIVGSFTTTNIGNTALRMLTISNPYVAGGGSQAFIESYGGADNTIYTILFEPTYGRVYYGGDFAGVGINLFGGATSCNFIGFWDIALAIWVSVAGNVFNGRVNKIVLTGHSELYAVGAFNMLPSTHNCYLDLSTTTASDSNIILTNPPTYQQAFHIGGQLAVMDGATFYREDAITTWTSLGIPEATGSVITGILNFSGDWKVIYNNYGLVRTHSTQPHSCVFTGSFKYDNTSYGNYTITPRNVSQQFIGDATCSFWSIIGAGVGTFS